MRRLDLADLHTRFGLRGTLLYTAVRGLHRLGITVRPRHLVVSEHLPASAPPLPHFETRLVTAEDFERAAEPRLALMTRRLAHPEIRAFGVFDGPILAAIGWLSLAPNPFDAAPPLDWQGSVFLWSDHTAPAYRRRGLHRHLLLYRLAFARQLGRTRAFAVIDRWNRASLESYARCGLTPISRFSR